MIFKWFRTKRCKKCGIKLSTKECQFCYLNLRIDQIEVMYHVMGGFKLDDYLFRDGEHKFRVIRKI